MTHLKLQAYMAFEGKTWVCKFSGERAGQRGLVIKAVISSNSITVRFENGEEGEYDAGEFYPVKPPEGS